MIIFEDRELESMVLAGQSCIAVPIEIYVAKGKEMQIITYSCFSKIAEEYERLFKADPFSVEALNWIDQKIHSDMKMFGYEHCYDDIHMMSEYYLSELKHLNSFINDDVRFINSDIELDGYDISLIEGISIDEEAAVVIKDDKLVSVSCINDVSFEDDSVEIFVETDSEFRNRGLGAATVSALTEKYLKKGITVRFKCAKNNIASISLAKKCGFVKTGERYSFVCFAVEDK